MNIYDISWPITKDMTAYKDRRVVQLEPTKQFDTDGARETLVTLGSHTGTHIDAPSHFLKEGKPIEQMSPLCCVGPAQVIDMTQVDDCIDVHHIASINIEPQHILLFKTKNSSRSTTAPFDSDFVYINAAAAQWLVEQRVRAVGIDYLGIERNQPAHETHTTFLQNDIPILEGLRLGHIEQGIYFLWCLPLSLPGLDAAPARALLLQE